LIIHLNEGKYNCMLRFTIVLVLVASLHLFKEPASVEHTFNFPGGNRKVMGCVILIVMVYFVCILILREAETR
jgi:uncharacterized membrane protein YidH (DUF202 family)